MSGAMNEQSGAGSGHTPKPSSMLILLLGIMAIAGCWLYAAPGLVCGIASVVLANKALGHGASYSKASLRNIRRGKIFGIAGIVLSGLFLVLLSIKGIL